ncbi:MAG: hypothetical protein P0Y53_11760 [Candidatus Pseudobacter hemicellulosilyticus]|uniref:Uncharacterized protein n=1 Tax=Candidatus Pseudobacter hemicellulosilyticus TaxID=3121375 RepID=A0AAJ5WX53_9BACT|nr:MAG: hypothetical protein P0Y53_11760 [Pseudobacter sp.]
MRIQFVKNIQFTKLLKVEGRLREFNFRKLGGENEGIFTVDVVDDRGNRILFRLKQESDGWKIMEQPLPNWIWENEKKLNEMLEEELRSM